VLLLLDLIGPVDKESDYGGGKDLTGVRFPEGFAVTGLSFVLQRANFGHATLDGARFTDCALARTSWMQARLRDSAFVDCDFSGAGLKPADATETTFRRCNFSDAYFGGNLSSARFHECRLRGANLTRLDLGGTVFAGCDLRGATFNGADLANATFTDCDLRGASWLDADITGVKIERCRIFGMAVWGTRGEIAFARSLSLARTDASTAPEIDALHLAPFIMSLLDGNGVRELVDGLSSTVVLILGRFAEPHKSVLDDVRSHLRRLGYSAVMFDTETPRSRDLSEAVSVLARLSRFVLVDLTEPRSAPYELQQFVATSQTPVLAVTRGEAPFSMFTDLEKYPWVLGVREFADGPELIEALPHVVGELEERRSELQTRRALASG
jgi:uncharacterized protein YjbI with pentapeptide repeats